MSGRVCMTHYYTPSSSRILSIEELIYYCTNNGPRKTALHGKRESPETYNFLSEKIL
jgi:hypothetical protein